MRLGVNRKSLVELNEPQTLRFGEAMPTLSDDEPVDQFIPPQG